MTTRITRRELLEGASSLPLMIGLSRGGIGTGVNIPAVQSILLAPTSFVGGSPVNTVVGTAIVTMNDGSTFSGTLTVDDTTDFKFSSLTLELAQTVATGSYPINVTATPSNPAFLPLTVPFTITGTGSGATVATRTLVNSAGSGSLTPTPFTIGVNLDRGVLPSGQIMTPQINGVPLATWQMDRGKPWDDNSFNHGVCRGLLPSTVAAGATVQLVFVASTGTWPNSSSVTLAAAAAEAASDHKIAISNLHTAQPLAAGTIANKWLQVGLTQSGGAITGGVVLENNAGEGNGTYTVVNGATTGGAPTTPAVIVVNNSTVTVSSGGSGYGLMGTNGSFVAGFQQAVALIGSAGNFNGAQVNQYAKGAACDAWEWRMPVLDATSSAVLPHLIAMGWEERWKKADGTLLTYRAGAHLINGSADFTDKCYNYTFDYDWKVGSTVIRGTSLGSTGYATCMVNIFSGARTFDPGNEAPGFISTGRLDWASNHAAYCAIIPQLTSAEVDSLFPLVPRLLTTFDGATKCASALINGNTTTGFSYSTAPSSQAAFYPKSPAQDEDSILALSQPMANAGIRCPAGSGSWGQNEGLFPNSFITWLLAMKNGSGAAAQKWLAHVRGANANWTISPVANPLLDPTNLTVFNSVPAAAPGQVMPHMPDNSTKISTSFSLGGYPSTIVNNGSGGFSGTFSPYHLPRYGLGLYIVEGERWQLFSELAAASTAIFYSSPPPNAVSNRLCTLGSTNYAGLWGATGSPTRVFFWTAMTLAGVVALTPPTWADGATNDEQVWALYQLRNQFKFCNDFVKFVGTVVCNGNTTMKAADLTASGCWDIMKYVDSTIQEPTEWLYIAYGAHAFPWAAYLHQDQGSGNSVADLKTFCNFFVTNSAANWAYSGSHYPADAPLQAQEYPGGAIISANRAALDPANAGWPAIPMSIQQITATSQSFTDTTNTGVQVSCSSGINTFSVASAGGGGIAQGVACGMMVKRGTGSGGLNNGGTMFADGSALWFSTVSIQNSGGPPIVALPGGFSLGTKYFIHNLTPAAGQVQQVTLHATYADAIAGTSPITPTTTVAAIQVWGAPSNALPPDTGAGSAGLYNDGPGPNAQGYRRIALAYGMAALLTQYAFKAPGDSAAYPGLDANVGITDAMNAAKSNTAAIAEAMGLTFKDLAIDAFA